MMKLSAAVDLAAELMLVAGCLMAQTQPDTVAVDRMVTSKLSAQFGVNAKVVRHLDLTQSFHTKSRWQLIIAEQPDVESSAVGGAGDREGAVFFCFVVNDAPDCSQELFLAKFREKDVRFRPETPEPFYELFTADIVYSGPGKTLPLIRIAACGTHGFNGNCLVSTFLLAWDEKAERFRVDFFFMTGRNNNEEARFIESGPLLGSVITAYPTSDAPFGYIVEVHKRTSDAEYARVLRYRSKTRYGDGNPLAVIDSDMPELLQRLGLWKTGDPLPPPPTLPQGCTRLVMRRGVEWCEPR